MTTSASAVTVKQALPKLRKIVADSEAQKIGRSLVDLTTATSILRVHEALSPDNRERLERMPVPLAATVAFRLLTGPAHQPGVMP